MLLDALKSYAGPTLTPEIRSILSILERHDITFKTTGPSRKTIRVFDGDRNLGYVNGTVVRRKGLLGYHFVESGYSSDSCPKHLMPTLIETFCERYSCTASAFELHEGSGSNTGRLYLLIRDPMVALCALQIDMGVEPDPDTFIARVDNLFVEGKVTEVLMLRRERDIKARNACLAVHGFSCFVCGANLKQRYTGITKEVIQVHHEEPLSEAEGEREFDAVATMKPLCPNCHCVVHSRNPPYTITEVRAMLSGET